MGWVRDHWILILAAAVVVGFFVLAVSQKEAAPTVSSIGTVRVDSPMHRGDAAATVSLIQYSDFLCPSCSYIATQVMPEIDETYIETGKVQFEFRPMAFIADGSVQAGMGAYCAVDQNKVWPYHDAIYTYVADKVYNKGMDPKTDTILTAAIVKDLAVEAGLEAEPFNNCLDSSKHAKDINDATSTANRQGVTSTPYVLVDGTPVSGNPNLQTIDAMIKAAL